jgi:hypothetical protein
MVAKIYALTTYASDCVRDHKLGESKRERTSRIHRSRCSYVDEAERYTPSGELPFRGAMTYSHRRQLRKPRLHSAQCNGQNQQGALDATFLVLLQ